MKKVLTCLVIVASLAIAGAAAASARSPKEKIISAQPIAQVAVDQALVLTASIPAATITEAQTLKAGVAFSQMKVIEAFGRQDSAIIAIGGERKGTANTSTIIAFARIHSIGIYTSAGQERPGCDSVANVSVADKYGQVKGAFA